MGRDTNKIYNKAMGYYQKGELSKALVECEKGISLDLRNASLLNLKGLLLYINGELSDAVAVWKINSHYNNDEISKIYIKDAKNDEDKLKKFLEAEKDIKELKIENAIEKLKVCSSSDFNSIKVNNGFAICYLRKGRFELAKEYNEKALRIDKNNKSSLSIKKELINLTNNPQDEFRRKLFKGVSTIFIIVIVAVVAIFINKGTIKTEINDGDNIEVEDNTINKNNDELVENTEEKEEEVILIVEKLTEEEINTLYIEATDLFEAKEYSKSAEVLEKAYNTPTESYLKEHILFLLASAYDEDNIDEKAIGCYEEYVKKYKTDSYIEEVYYKLAILYSEIDKTKSEDYAKRLKYEYPKSIYVNSIIDEIISN